MKRKIATLFFLLLLAMQTVTSSFVIATKRSASPVGDQNPVIGGLALYELVQNICALTAVAIVTYQVAKMNDELAKKIERVRLGATNEYLTEKEFAEYISSQLGADLQKVLTVNLAQKLIKEIMGVRIQDFGDLSIARTKYRNSCGKIDGYTFFGKSFIDLINDGWVPFSRGRDLWMAHCSFTDKSGRPMLIRIDRPHGPSEHQDGHGFHLHWVASVDNTGWYYGAMKGDYYGVVFKWSALNSPEFEATHVRLSVMSSLQVALVYKIFFNK